MTATKTIATAVPSVAPPPLLRHLLRKKPDGGLEDRALCGFIWDVLLGPGPLCDACGDEFLRLHGHRHPIDRRPT